MSFSQERRTFIIEHDFTSHSYVTVRERFGNTFPDVSAPQKSTIKRIIDRFRTHHTIENLPKAGRPSVHTSKNVDKAITEFEQYPHISIRRAAAAFGLSPDLSPPDFFLWAYLKNHVYEKNPKTLE